MIMTKFQKFFLLILFSVLYFMFSTDVRAQALNLKAPKTTYAVGESFQVSLTIDTAGRYVNTVSGKVIVPTDKFQILDVRYGNSIVTLWVERPKVDGAKGTITFAGGVPGGFSGSAGPILSFVIKAKAAGSGTLALQEIKVLLNDGQGTELSGVKSGSLKLAIEKAKPLPLPSPKAEEELATSTQEEYAPPPDTIPPEAFVPLISRHPSVSGNKYFVSFFAADKDSGVERYEVKEISALWPFDAEDWVRSESPYILKNQWWRTRVLVRAYDQAENVAEAEAIKPFHPLVSSAFALLAVLAGIFLGRFFYKPFPKKRVKLKS